MTRLVGNLAPDFRADALVDGEFKNIALNDYYGKWVLLFFYPLDFTFVCPTEINSFSENAGKFKDKGCQILGCSVDSKFSHLAWSKMSKQDGGIEGIAFPLIADIKKEIASRYGVLIEHSGVALRGLFLIDPDRVIQHSCINNLNVGRSVNEAMRLLDGFQYTRKHGEVCPMNWEPGSDTIKPNPEESKEFFSKD